MVMIVKALDCFCCEPYVEMMSDCERIVGQMGGLNTSETVNDSKYSDHMPKAR